MPRALLEVHPDECFSSALRERRKAAHYVSRCLFGDLVDSMTASILEKFLKVPSCFFS